MKLLKGIFLLIVLLQFMACGGGTTLFTEEDLHGDWKRVWSTDPRSDSMVIRIEENYAIVIFAPDSSDFEQNDLKWIAISPVVEPGNFQFYDSGLGADDEYWKASIEMTSLTSFKVTSLDYPDAPGGKQKWIKL